MEEMNTNFIHEAINKDLADGVYNRVQTRFPPEPNGYLHIGHVKAICIDFGMSQKYNGTCNLRLDDTNPTKEDTEYVDAIMSDISWLGFKWDKVLYASDYFDDIYPKVELALSKEELKEYTALKTAIDTYAQEMEQKWILGSEDVDKTWDAYIKNLESLGIDRLTELNQMGYDRIKSRG